MKSTSAKLSGPELLEILESLRTRPGMMLKSKKSSGGPPVLTPNELRQMLEDTHVTKVPKRKQIDPLITLLEDDSGDTKLDLTKKSALSSEEAEIDSSKTRQKSEPININRITQKMEHSLKVTLTRAFPLVAIRCVPTKPKFGCFLTESNLQAIGWNYEPDGYINSSGRGLYVIQFKRFNFKC